MERRLTTLMVADVVGYSRMMEQAEELTAIRLQECQELILNVVNASGGRVFNRAGDAALAEFDSPINAVRSAVTIREKLAGKEADGEDGLQLRFGLHLADVMVSGDDLLGDGVNVAARIQQSAHADSICVSEALFDQIKRHAPFAFEDLGEHRFKNLSEPMRIYRLSGYQANHRLQCAPTQFERSEVKEIAPNSIAVLPFTAGDTQEDQRYLSEGLTDEIILELARFKKLRVTSRSACFAFAGKSIEPAVISQKLGVNYVLEGQVRRLGDRIRLSLQLTNGQSGLQVWSDRMTGEFEDVFDLMDAVTARVAATILGRVEADAIAIARRKPPENMTAYDFVLRGLDYHRIVGVTWDNARAAVRWFDKAIESDPTYGPAYAWRICASSWLPEFDLEKEKHFIDRAVELDPNDAEAQRIMGTIQMINGDYDAAAYHHRRAIELSPQDAYLLARSAAFYTFCDQPEEALKLIDKAAKLDPLLPVWCVEERGIALFAMGKNDEAVKALNEIPFQTYRTKLYQCAALMAADRIDEAGSAMKQALAINPELTAIGFMRKENWRDLDKRARIRNHLIEAGLPR